MSWHRLAAEVLADAGLVITPGRDHEVVAAAVAVDPHRAGCDGAHGAHRAAGPRCARRRRGRSFRARRARGLPLRRRRSAPLARDRRSPAARPGCRRRHPAAVSAAARSSASPRRTPAPRCRRSRATMPASRSTSGSRRRRNGRRASGSKQDRRQACRSGRRGIARNARRGTAAYVFVRPAFAAAISQSDRAPQRMLSNSVRTRIPAGVAARLHPT